MLIKLLLISLGTLRLTYLLRYEKGPFDISKKFRESVGITKNSSVILEGEPVEQIDDTFLAQLVSCNLCLSGWVTLIIIALPQTLQLWLASWGVFYLLETLLFEKDQ